MKTRLRISVWLNVILLGGVVILWRHPRTVAISVPVKPAIPVEVEPREPAAPIVQMMAEPFHWSQLESTNGYLAFVANLRRAGCPEPTVEDIVWGNVQRAFDWKRGQLRVDKNEPGLWSEKSQLALVDFLLGRASSAPATEIAADPGQTPTPGRSQLSYLPAIVPLAMRNLDLTPLGLSSDQMQAVEQARQDFLQQTGGTQPTPDDKNYAADLLSWQQAQTMADYRLHSTLGTAYWKLLEMAAGQHAEEMSSQN
jgi:hypothetical protein